MADFYATEHSTKDNTIVHRPDNLISYIIETPSKILQLHHERSTIFKGPYREPIGFIEFHGFHDNIVEIRGRSFLPQRARESSHFSESKEFIASDGRAYKWKFHSHEVWELLTQDGTHTLVARYDRKNISIYPQALHIADEVMVTLFYMRQYKKKKDNERRRDHVGLD
ncbi:hypothetical protein EV368DRAFT_66660 [Lentinula lateritia]|uniref:Uncharacterized protein n=1 Tax=Lentinula aff. lateritia TaxID=2804960 RepID=A0ACC1UCC7_9AGAR|nr:hypothetical protein F5876DRAFT_62360 [Lentinula aff. lateritia]KAJ3850355.1 hypothetical protein EV368DRAFT_66660 [Lentinula lateritia]